MSDALERVIAQQQKEIDRLKSLDESNNTQWQKEYRRREDLMTHVFGFMHSPESPEYRFALRKAIRAYGYCLTCEYSPCQCREDD